MIYKNLDQLDSLWPTPSDQLNLFVDDLVDVGIIGHYSVINFIPQVLFPVEPVVYTPKVAQYFTVDPETFIGIYDGYVVTKDDWEGLNKTLPHRFESSLGLYLGDLFEASNCPGQEIIYDDHNSR